MNISDDMLRNAVNAWAYIVNEKKKGLEPAGEPRNVVRADDASFALVMAVAGIMQANKRGSLDDDAAAVLQMWLLVVREFLVPLPPYMVSGEDNVSTLLRDLVEEIRLGQVEVDFRQRERDERKQRGPDDDDDPRT